MAIYRYDCRCRGLKTPRTCCMLLTSFQSVNKFQQTYQFHEVATSVLQSGSLQLVICRLVTTCHLQTCYNLLKQLAASLWIKSFDSQLATSLLTTCNRLVVNKLSQAMRTHPDIGLLITSLLIQDVNRLVAPRNSLFWRREMITNIPK